VARRLLPASGKKRLSVGDVRALVAHAAAIHNESARAAARVERALRRIDKTCRFSNGARAVFQDCLAAHGLTTTRRIDLPCSNQPFWFRVRDRLANYQSAPSLPASADVVVIGAGLTGASTAYHLADAAKTGRVRVVVLDQGDPASEASGRNGGNFELIPENSVGAYVGLAHERLGFLERCYPRVPSEVTRAVSERQASLVLGIALRNRDLLKSIILREGIDCDFSPKGWLHLASSDDEEQGICDEVSLAAEHGQRIEIWSRHRIREEFGFETESLGRFIPGDGTYHPLKYVCGLLRSALRFGVELFTHVRVKRVRSSGPNRHVVATNRGTIVAKTVVVATNAFTSRLLPELKGIRPYQSQVFVTEHVPDRARGRIVTCDHGPVFFNQPREGMADGHAPLLFGGGDDRPMANPSSRRRSPAIHAQLVKLRDSFYPELRGRPPSTEWVGPMGFTADQLPAIGFLRPGVIVAAGFNGYGGSYTTAAGNAAAQMALTRQVPEWVPDDTFSPRRLTTREPLFLSDRDSLWRVAVSLCRQLKAVNREIAELLSFEHRVTRRTPRATFALRASAPRPRRAAPLAAHKSRPGSTVSPALLKALPAFARFTHGELARMIRAMRRWDLPRGTTLFSEGAPGGSCFIVVRGAVDVTIEVRGEPHQLATLQPGSIFGQMSLVVNEPRAATCTVSDEALLLEIDRRPCERLLNGRSALALKWLSALNQDLIAALRGADQRLMRMKRGSDSQRLV
jgi:glycine/D-amino acid oxidase-like deaminating enzyme